MNKRVLPLLVAVLIIAGLFFLVQWRAANVIIDAEDERVALGESIKGMMSITLDSGDSIQKDTAIFISLTSSNNTVLATKSLTLDDFMKLSDKNPQPTERDGDFYYQEQGTYSVEIQKLIPYTFNQPGNFEILFSILKLDLTVRKNIIVQ